MYCRETVLGWRSRNVHSVLIQEEAPDTLLVYEHDVLSALTKLNPRKAAGPDCIANWLLREYAKILVRSITSITNASFKEQRLTASWKLEDVVPLPKQRPVQDPGKHLLPISLTPAISKLAEDFVVSTHVGPAVLIETHITVKYPFNIVFFMTGYTADWQTYPKLNS